MKCLLQSFDFRMGILDGWHMADGDVIDRRGFTTSKNLFYQLDTLITSLGMVTNIGVAIESGHSIDIRGGNYTSNYPVYKIRWYETNNRRVIKDTYKVINNSIYFKIKSIEKVDYDYNIYYFKFANKEEPYFTLPNGIIVYSGGE